MFAMPSLKTCLVVGGAVSIGAFLGPKISTKFVGPEQTPGDVRKNEIIEYGTIAALGLASFVVLGTLLKVG